MNDKNRNLAVRIVSALILLPVVIYLVWRGGWWTASLLGVAAAICASEYYTIVWKKLPPIAWLGIAGAGLMPFLPVLADNPWRFAFYTVGLMFLLTWTYHLIRGPLAEAPTRAAHALTGMIYGALGLSAIMALRLIPDQGIGWVIACLVVTWMNDTCAYFAGRFLGKHKLYPEVSPNKTWEGFFGGMAGSIAGMFVLKAFFFPFLGTVDCIVVGLAGGIFGPVGDLAESMLKRAYQVKDSGKIIPGHGGLLDRIDALIFNAPMVFAWVMVVKPLFKA